MLAIPHAPKHALAAIAAAAAMLAATPVQAVDFQLVSHIGDRYTYTLTYTDNDNMKWTQNGNIEATITLTGLFGVTGVEGPTDTDFLPGAPHVHEWQLKWVGQVDPSGKAVQFRMPDHDAGTGNFPQAKHVFGFTLIAPNTGLVDKIVLNTNGFYCFTPGSCPVFEDRDVVQRLIEGPGFFAPQVPEPGTYALMALGLAGVGWVARRRRAG